MSSQGGPSDARQLKVDALMRFTRLLVTTAVLALVAGAVISVLAFVVARYGPAGDGWSFRGNGALAVYTRSPCC